jgi:hypothetical protein
MKINNNLMINAEVLKVLPSEMDTAEIRLLRKVVIKERGAEVFWKNPPAPHPLRAL